MSSRELSASADALEVWASGKKSSSLMIVVHEAYIYDSK